MAVKTSDFGASRAVNFFKGEAVYFGIGKKTPWPNEDKPPNVHADTQFVEPIGYKKADRVYIVAPHDGSTLPSGSIVIDHAENSLWKVVNPEDAFKEKARYVYIETSISAEDFPAGDYRQIAVFTGLTRKSGVSDGKLELLPAEVQSTGVMELIDNQVRATRNEVTKEFLSYVIRF